MPNTIIETTTDHSVFKIIKGNRKFNSAHIRKLRESIENNPEYTRFNPILVNERMEVINGQHRLEALKQLNLPVHFIRANGLRLEAVQTLNSGQKPWSPMDYARSYSDMGYKDYDVYIDFKIRFGLNHDTLISYLGHDSNPITRNKFESGTMKIADINRAEKLCNEFLEVAEAWNPKEFKKRAYTTSFKMMWETPGYDQGRMVRQMQLYGKRLTSPGRWQDALRELEDLYNHYQTVKFIARPN